MKLYRKYEKWFYKVHGWEYEPGGIFDDTTSEEMGKFLGMFIVTLFSMFIFSIYLKGWANSLPKPGIEIQPTAVIQDGWSQYHYEYEYLGETYQTDSMFVPTRVFDKLVGKSTILVNPIMPQRVKVYYPARIISGVCNVVLLCFSLTFLITVVSSLKRCQQLEKQNRSISR